VRIQHVRLCGSATASRAPLALTELTAPRELLATYLAPTASAGRGSSLAAVSRPRSSHCSAYRDDRRAYVITLTAAGRKMQARGEEAVDADAVHFFGRLSEHELQELHRLLARLSGRSE